MNRIYLKKKMLDEGISLISLASELGVSTNAVYLVISGKTSSKKIETAIEKIFELSIYEIREAWKSVPSKEECSEKRKAVFASLGLPA